MTRPHADLEMPEINDKWLAEQKAMCERAIAERLDKTVSDVYLAQFLNACCTNYLALIEWAERRENQ